MQKKFVTSAEILMCSDSLSYLHDLRDVRNFEKLAIEAQNIYRTLDIHMDLCMSESTLALQKLKQQTLYLKVLLICYLLYYLV